jgi:hypothetical protein
MAEIEEGTQFIGVSANVPIPENKSSQNNSFQEVYTIEDISNSAKNGKIEDFFVFTGKDYHLLFKRTKAIVNGKPEWGYYDEANDITYTIRINGDQTIWKLLDGNNDIALIGSINDDDYPPSGDWDFDGDIVSVNIFYVGRSIQEAIEQLALLTLHLQMQVQNK